MEVVGIHNIVAKSLGTHNPYNTILATLDGLSKLKDSESVVKRTSKAEEE
jgi:small subunit ribosomal protein S5